MKKNCFKRIRQFCLFFLFLHLDIQIEAEPFTKTTVLQFLKAEISQFFNGEKIDIELNQWGTQWEKKEDTRIEMTNLKIMPDQKTFSAVLSNGKGFKVAISGKIIKFVELPVLNTPMDENSVISHQDISYKEFRSEMLKIGIAVKAETLVGQTVRKGCIVHANQPIHYRYLEKNILVRKGKPIVLKYKVPGIEISLPATAQSNGGKGDQITIEARTKKILQATVVSAGEAEIRGS